MRAAAQTSLPRPREYDLLVLIIGAQASKDQAKALDACNYLSGRSISG
jgi:hypothetical protein